MRFGVSQGWARSVSIGEEVGHMVFVTGSVVIAGELLVGVVIACVTVQ